MRSGALRLDAIAGVVNFITRENFEGVEARVSGQTFEESDGEYQAGIMGGGNDRWHITAAAEYERRSEVSLSDLDWAVRPFASNPQGGYSGINPGTIFPFGVNNADTGAIGIIGRVIDLRCEEFEYERQRHLPLPVHPVRQPCRKAGYLQVLRPGDLRSVRERRV